MIRACSFWAGPGLFCLGRFVLLAADVPAALKFRVSHAIIAVKMSHRTHRPEALAVDDRLDPFVAIVSHVQVMLLVDSQANFGAAIITLNIEEETLVVRTRRSRRIASAEKLLQETHGSILLRGAAFAKSATRVR
jgi:hypothetical protein